MSAPILSLRGVTRTYVGRKASGWGWSHVHAVREVSLEVHEGETLAIVGESGSGKSTLAKLLLMLERASGGHVTWRGTPLAQLQSAQRSAYRREVQAVFQDPASSLNPRMSVERSLGYIVRRHALCAPHEQRELLARQLESVGLTPAQDYLGRIPHQLSGGQQQRIAIARAMMMRPRIIIADEPLSSLDVSIQAQVLQLMQELRQRTGVGFVIISHDLGAMQAIAERTAVMYRGRIVEIGSDVYERPTHPYTRLLLDARLDVDPRSSRIRSGAAAPAAAAQQRTPGAAHGCSFAGRCPYAVAVCEQSEPVLRPVGASGTQAACHRAQELVDTAALDRPLPASAIPA